MKRIRLLIILMILICLSACGKKPQVNVVRNSRGEERGQMSVVTKRKFFCTKGFLERYYFKEFKDSGLSYAVILYPDSEPKTGVWISDKVISTNIIFDRDHDGVLRPITGRSDTVVYDVDEEKEKITERKADDYLPDIKEDVKKGYEAKDNSQG